MLGRKLTLVRNAVNSLKELITRVALHEASK